MLDQNNPIVSFALETVRQAARLVKMIQTEMVSPALTKDDHSPVTVADFAAQALVGSLLEARFPDDLLVAEECSTTLHEPAYSGTLEQIQWHLSRIKPTATSENICRWIDRGTAAPARRFWVLDPIDGTKGFLRGDQYAIALALVENGSVQLGVLGCPNLLGASQPDFNSSGSLVIAARGQGSWVTALDGDGAYQKLSVSPCAAASDARILRSFEAGHTNSDQITRLAQTLGTQVPPLLFDSQAKYALLAAGAGEILLRIPPSRQIPYHEKIWDQAAGSLVVEEAGGQVTDLDGKPLDFTRGRSLTTNRGILASNGYLHSAALQAVKAVEAHE